MKTKADQLLHPALTVILEIKVVLTTIAVMATVVNIFMNLDAVTMADWLQVFLTVVAIYGAWLMLQTRKQGFYLVVIPHLIMGIISLFFLPYMMKGMWMSFGQIAFIMLLMLLRRDGKNAYQVLWGNANIITVSDEESLTTELEGEPEETSRNPQDKRFVELFKGQKPLIGMIHANHTNDCSVLELAQKEIEVYLKYGIYPLIENYFGSTEDCEDILAWMQKEHPDAIYGVNILGNYPEAFRLAKEYGASFIQIDSVCGHLMPKDDDEYAEQLLRLRMDSDVVLLGGVRFKYQPVLSGRSLEEDLKLGAERCDAIVCTGGGTGQPTPFDKVREFKSVLNDFPVIVGAGVTIDTIGETFDLADGAIVGSWFKERHRDCFNVNEEYVKQMVRNI